MSAIENVVEELSQADSLHDIYMLLGRTLNRWGFGRFAYLVMRGLGPDDDFWMADYPQGWSAHYLDRDYVHVDPVVWAARTTTLPFHWNDLAAKFPKAHQLPIHEAGEFGLKNGITVPLRGPGQCSATFNFTAPLPNGEAAGLWRERHFDLHLLALYAHEAIVNRVYATPDDRLIILYPRERECLLWASRGKTAWEIGNILHLSEQTVTGYLKSAARKLGVYSKTHAVVKAILLGIILP